MVNHEKKLGLRAITSANFTSASANCLQRGTPFLPVSPDVVIGSCIFTAEGHFDHLACYGPQISD